MFFAFLIFILLFKNSSSIVESTTGGFIKVLDKRDIVVSLEGYNVSSPEGDSFDSLHKLPPYSKSKILLTNIPADAHFVLLQAHSFLVDVILSLDYVPVQNNSITGTNVGLIKMNEKTDLSFYLTYNSSVEEVDVMVSVQAYPKGAPIPGGCNMEFQVEVSPFLLTAYNEDITEVNVSPSAPPVSVLPQSLALSSDECNIKPSPVHYIMFHRYSPERDFTKENYFNALKSMMTVGRILKNGALVSEKLTGSPMKRIFATYPGTGNTFVVISHFENQTAVYVPSFTYGCSSLEDNDTCSVLLTTFSKVLCATALFMGLFTCFFGHYFFRIEIFLFGFLASGIVTYILVSILFINTIALPASVSVGLFTASTMLIAWTIFGLPIISVTLTTLTFGFLLASMIYYPLIDHVDFMVLDINFWGIFIGIVLSCPILMLYLAEKANIISCAFLGSYVAVMSVDHYIGSNLRYIFINTIRRAVVKNFNLAVIDPPFQFKDILLCFAWALLMAMGSSVQRSLMRNKPPYPPPVNPLKNCFKRWKRPAPLANQSNERTPLLVDLSSNISEELITSNYPRYSGN